MIRIKDIAKEQYNIISERTDGKCFYCGNEVKKDWHFHNIEKEGFVLSCTRCHDLRGDKTYIEFKEYLAGLFEQLKKSNLYSVLFDINKVSEISKEVSFFGEKVDKSIERIKKTVCVHFGIKEKEIDRKTKKRDIVVKRQIAHYIAVLNTKKSLAEIGRKIGNRAYSTVLHSKRTIINLIDTYPEFKKELNIISEKYNYKI